MKTITHHLNGHFLESTGYKRPEGLELRSRVVGGEQRLVFLEFVDVDPDVDVDVDADVERSILRLPLLLEEAGDIANTLYQLAREAGVEEED